MPVPGCRRSPGHRSPLSPRACGKGFRVPRSSRCRVDPGIPQDCADVVEVAGLRTPRADGIEIPRDRSALSPEVPETVRQQRDPEIALQEAVPVDPVHQFDLEHVQVVLLFGRPEPAVRHGVQYRQPAQVCSYVRRIWRKGIAQQPEDGGKYRSILRRATLARSRFLPPDFRIRASSDSSPGTIRRSSSASRRTRS